jgi:hypothetical protein
MGPNEVFAQLEFYQIRTQIRATEKLFCSPVFALGFGTLQDTYA